MLATEQPPALGFEFVMMSDGWVGAAARKRIQVINLSYFPWTAVEGVTWETVTLGYVNTLTSPGLRLRTVLGGLATGGVEVPVLAEAKEGAGQGGR